MTLAKIIVEAKALGGTIVDSPAAVVIVVPRIVESRSHLPLAEAAQLGGVSEKTMRREIRAGRLVASGTRRTLVVDRADLDRWIESRAVRVPSADDELDAMVRAREAAEAAE
jgi:excisionase family DNA binding protein